MQWHDEGIVIRANKYGERSLILTIVTRNYGRHKGIYKNKNINIATHVHCSWQSRLSSQLGVFRCEDISTFTHNIISKRLSLLMFNSACELLDKLLPEREPHPDIYDSFMCFLNNVDINSYCKLEMKILSLFGVVVDTTKCVVCKSKENIKFISPNSGKAVCVTDAVGYEKKLLTIPTNINESINLNSFFLNKFILPGIKITSRDKLIMSLSKGENNNIEGICV